MVLKHKRFYSLIFSLIILSLSVNAFCFERYKRVKKYDRYFSKYSKRYFGPGFDWKYFKAQAVAESRLKKNAKSYVGAKGVMQIMPKTFAEIKRKNPTIKGNLYQPKWNISAGIWYNKSIWKIFTEERPLQDKIDFMFGSYNAGKGNILKAQRIAKQKKLNPNLWSSIEETLPKVTGKHSKETLGYIKKIKQIKGVLKKWN